MYRVCRVDTLPHCPPRAPVPILHACTTLCATPDSLRVGVGQAPVERFRNRPAAIGDTGSHDFIHVHIKRLRSQKLIPFRVHAACRTTSIACQQTASIKAAGMLPVQKGLSLSKRSPCRMWMQTQFGDVHPQQGPARTASSKWVYWTYGGQRKHRRCPLPLPPSSCQYLS